MGKKYRDQYIRLTVRLVLAFCIPYKVQASDSTAVSYTLRTINISSTGAIDPISVKPYPCLRLVKWLTPTTDVSLIYSAINLESGAIFDRKMVLSIKKRLMELPYFSTVSIIRKVVDSNGNSPLSDLMIQTKDRFPITFGFSLDEGPLLTITHHNAWGYGHGFTQEFFLKKRWGYGCMYELPKLHGNYFFGGQCYNQIEDTYEFNHKNLWIGKLWAIPAKRSSLPYYWITGLSGYVKEFSASPPVSDRPHSPYHSYRLILGKVGWVADGYTTIRGVYKLNALERLPNGGSIEVLYGYQNGAYNNRHYIAINGIKNIAHPTFKYLHVSFESGAFVYKKRLEEAILKLALAYLGPPIRTCNGMRQSIAINYIIGYRMPQERALGIRIRDPESLAPLDQYNRLQQPIYGRLNVQLQSTLHQPIVIQTIRLVCLGFTHFIGLYNQSNQLLNQTWVDRYGVGVQLEHVRMSWPTLACTIGYSPLLEKVVPSVQLSIGHFKNKTMPKPTLIAYS
ncbi:hypothetical protein ACRRVB_02215 [Candidatus Cardinium hertigii]|uniref:hypothetical protein n=1 Tax=Candidatus Cardinium hertigii TaxID=247481 RepID=UPI003D7CCFA3